MLRIKVPAQEFWDAEKQEFVYSKACELQLEHSLVSLAKWEAEYGRPFLSKKEMTEEESLFYIKCMTITQNVDDSIYDRLSEENLKEIKEYIENPMTATHFSEDKKFTRGGREVITAELIYYWMVALNIPLECQKWHLNRLLTLIRVCNIKNQPPKKMSRREILSRNAALNAARKKMLGTRG